jgi:aminoglycoside phosphotransferase (APT) family kinase protein
MHLSRMPTIDQDLAAQRVHREFPGLDLDHFSFLAEGCDCECFLADGRWVFRFPKNAEVARQLRVEATLLPRLEQCLGIRVPAIRFVAKRDQFFVGYEWIAGAHGDEARKVSARVPLQIAAMLSRLHQFPLEEARAMGVPEAGNTIPAWQQRALEILEQNPQCGVPRLVLEQAPRPYRGIPRLIHNDLEGEHMLLNPSTGDLIGVIDWTDAALGDPAIDLAGLIYWRGPAFAREVTDAYECPLDEDFFSRARWHALCGGLHALALGRLASRPRWTAAGRQAIKHALSE